MYMHMRACIERYIWTHTHTHTPANSRGKYAGLQTKQKPKILVWNSPKQKTDNKYSVRYMALL